MNAEPRREYDWTPSPKGAKRDPVPVALDERKGAPRDER